MPYPLWPFQPSKPLAKAEKSGREYLDVGVFRYKTGIQHTFCKVLENETKEKKPLFVMRGIQTAL